MPPRASEVASRCPSPARDIVVAAGTADGSDAADSPLNYRWQWSFRSTCNPTAGSTPSPEGFPSFMRSCT